MNTYLLPIKFTHKYCFVTLKVRNIVTNNYKILKYLSI